ncbi:MAG: hypothetical protein LYZ70_02850 [Nitrososphaerales archaeon]|nr:hypothetical protein [Nitrososphaerales archaeon]
MTVRVEEKLPTPAVGANRVVSSPVFKSPTAATRVVLPAMSLVALFT